MCWKADTSLPTKVHIVKAMVFPVVTYNCENWTIKKAEHQRIDAFKQWCWRWFLRVPWIARRSNQSILKEINPEYSLEGLMVKLKLQYFGHMMWTADSLEKSLMLGKTDGKRRDGWMASPMQWTWTWEMVRDREAWLGSQRVEHDWMTEQKQQQSSKIDYGDGHVVYEYAKTCWIEYFKWANCIVCKLHINKAVKKKIQ